MNKVENNQIYLHSLKQVLQFNCARIKAGEKQLCEALWRWQYTIRSSKLRDILMRYTQLSNRHLNRLSEFAVRELMDIPEAPNRVMQALIMDTDSRLVRCMDEEIAEACLLASIQEINHYKISVYGTAAAFSHMLGLSESEAMFREAEMDEKRIDDRLTQLAGFEINPAALEPHVLAG